MIVPQNHIGYLDARGSVTLKPVPPLCEQQAQLLPMKFLHHERLYLSGLGLEACTMLVIIQNHFMPRKKIVCGMALCTPKH